MESTFPPAIFDLRPAYEASDVRRMFRLEHVRTLFIQSMRVVGIVLMVLVAADLVLFAVLARDRLTTSQFLESGLLFGFSLFLLLLARTSRKTTMPDIFRIRLDAEGLTLIHEDGRSETLPWTDPSFEVELREMPPVPGRSEAAIRSFSVTKPSIWGFLTEGAFGALIQAAKLKGLAMSLETNSPDTKYISVLLCAPRRVTRSK